MLVEGLELVEGAVACTLEDGCWATTCCWGTAGAVDVCVTRCAGCWGVGTAGGGTLYIGGYNAWGGCLEVYIKSII